MKQNSWTRAAIGAFVLIILTVFILHSHQAHATFTATGTSLTGDSNSTIDVTGTLGIGNTNTTSITIGQIGQGVTFPGNLILSGITGSTQCLQVNTSGQVSGTGSACGSGSTSPGGSNTQIQFNNAGAFGASAALVWLSPTLTIGIPGSTTGQLALAGATSGTTILQSATAAGGTVTLPAATGSLPYYTGSPISGNCVSWGSSGLLSDVGSACGSGSTSPGGSNTQIQFNNAGAFGASAALVWSSSTLTIGIPGSTTGQLALAGATSGTTILQPAAAASGTLTFPATTGSIPYYTGAPTSGNCVSWGSSGLLSDAGSACGSSGRDSGSQVYNVLAFPGVDPTGHTDSTAGIQAVINLACPTAGPGGIVFFPAGTYLVSSSTLTVPTSGSGANTVQSFCRLMGVT